MRKADMFVWRGIYNRKTSWRSRRLREGNVKKKYGVEIRIRLNYFGTVSNGATFNRVMKFWLAGIIAFLEEGSTKEL